MGAPEVSVVAIGKHLVGSCWAGLSNKQNMEVKLTPAVNFTNILRAPFLYESEMLSFSVITVWLCNFFVARKCALKLLL
jgi:hypothetical protein